MLLSFIITSFIIAIIPGIGVIYTSSVALGRGFWAGFLAATGCTLSILTHLCASLLGFSIILHQSATLFQIVKIAGILYLFYMAWSMWQRPETFEVSKLNTTSNGKIIRDGIVLNILNPKLTIFFIAFLPPFVPNDVTNPNLQLLALGLIFMAITYVVMIGYAALATQIRKQVLTQPKMIRYLNRSFACVFCLLGLKLASEQ